MLKLNLDLPTGIKRTHTVCFSFYNVNEMPMSPIEQIFIVKPQGLHVLLSEIR